MLSAQRLLVAVLVICILNLPLIQSGIFSPNAGSKKSLGDNHLIRAAKPTKVQTLKAYVKGYAKGAGTMAAVLTVFKIVQLEKLFELIFGRDTSVEDLQKEIMEKFDEIEDLVSMKQFFF
jgi:hypothetical protein